MRQKIAEACRQRKREAGGTRNPGPPRPVIRPLWSRFVVGWYEGGKNDRKLALLLFDAERGECGSTLPTWWLAQASGSIPKRITKTMSKVALKYVRKERVRRTDGPC